MTREQIMTASVITHVAKRQSEVLFIETDKEKLDIFDEEGKQE